MPKQKKPEAPPCMECGAIEKLHPHPSTGVENRICSRCFVNWHETAIEELMSYVNNHKSILREFRRSTGR